MSEEGEKTILDCAVESGRAALVHIGDNAPPVTGECLRCGFNTYGENTILCGDCELDEERDERALGIWK